MSGFSYFASRSRFATQAVLFLAVLVSAACAPQGAQPSPELAAMSDRWAAALAAGDVDGIVDFYTPNCRILPPNAPMAEGHEAVRAIFGEMAAAGLTAKIETIEAVAAGDIGHKIGHYTLIAPDGSVVDKGKFSEAWKKTAAGWQISSDMYSSDLPAPGSGAMVIVTHDVKDGDAWLAAWSGDDNRHAMFAANGASSTRTFRNPENPDEVGLLIEVADMDTLMTFLNSPETQAAKTEDGVIDSTLRFHTEAK